MPNRQGIYQRTSPSEKELRIKKQEHLRMAYDLIVKDPAAMRVFVAVGDRRSITLKDLDHLCDLDPFLVMDAIAHLVVYGLLQHAEVGGAKAVVFTADGMAIWDHPEFTATRAAAAG